MDSSVVDGDWSDSRDGGWCHYKCFVVIAEPLVVVGTHFYVLHRRYFLDWIFNQVIPMLTDMFPPHFFERTILIRHDPFCCQCWYWLLIIRIVIRATFPH